MGTRSRIYPKLVRRILLFVVFLARALTASAQTSAASAPLLLPEALTFDLQGNLYFAETANHVIRRIDPSGSLTIIAGSGAQGFDGDAGPATAALLDSPQGLAITANGTIYLADTHNHRIRQVDPSTGTITTVAGTGTAAFSGDAGPATAAALNLPTALALDTTGNLYLADTGNHRIRRIDAVTGTISTIAGDGVQGISDSSLDSPTGLAVSSAGDLYLADTHNRRIRRIDHLTGIMTTVATSADLALPRGLVADASGNLYIADSANHRIRRIDATTGLISTVAGDGTQAYAGDGGPAVTASLDSAHAVSLSPNALVTLSDTANQRIRQVDANGTIHTFTGQGVASIPGAVTITAPPTLIYGTGTMTASVTPSTASGTVTFFDTTSTAILTLGTAQLVGGMATLATGKLLAGTHRISASYPGDGTVQPAASTPLALVISPAALLATPTSITTLYGAPLPAITGTLTGLLAQDSTTLSVTYGTPATALSPTGTYPITASLTGTSAGNYLLTVAPAGVKVAPAPTTGTLTVPATSPASSTISIAARVTPSTSGLPTGLVSLHEGGQTLASTNLAAGVANFPPLAFAAGTHTLTAIYAGDGNFLASTTPATTTTITSAATSDFTLAATGQTSISVIGGAPATFSFQVSPTGPPLSSPILLAVTGMPTGTAASFSPAYLPPGATAFQLTLLTPTALVRWPGVVTVALILVPMMFVRGRRYLLTGLLAGGLLGCGDRVNTAPTAATKALKNYTIIVTATGTTADGSVIVRTATVGLTVQ